MFRLFQSLHVPYPVLPPVSIQLLHKALKKRVVSLLCFESLPSCPGCTGQMSYLFCGAHVSRYVGADAPFALQCIQKPFHRHHRLRLRRAKRQSPCPRLHPWTSQLFTGPATSMSTLCSWTSVLSWSGQDTGVLCLHRVLSPLLHKHHDHVNRFQCWHVEPS